MRIHTDHNGVAVNAFSGPDHRVPSRDQQGHVYQVIHGAGTTILGFQQGPIPEHGVNGLTNEALLAVLIHRTEHLDSQFPCDENKRAIADMKNALVNFEVRTARRMVRGVEGMEVV